MKKQNRYETGMIGYYDLKEQVKLPKFQRPLVWPEKDIINFLDSIHKGFPFGSLLLYKYKEENKLSLIDGLQRFTALKKFEKNRIKYIAIDEYIEKILVFFIDKSSTVSSSEKNDKINKIKNIVNEVFKKSELDVYELRDTLLENMPSIIDENGKTELPRIQDQISKHIKNYIDLESVKIPYVEFNGDEGELSTIFEKLNRGGKTLSRFQVFAAQWSNYEIELNDDKYNKKIIQIIASRYTKLNKTREIEIEGFDYDDFLEEKKINLSEFCYALGEIICEEIPFEKISENLKDEFGYISLAVVLNIDPRKLHEIVEKKEEVNQEFIEKISDNILKIYIDIKEFFAKIYKHPGKKEKYNFTFSNYQYLSFFTTLWKIKINEKFEINAHYKNKYEETLKNFNRHYLNDLLKETWSSTGDKKLYECYEKNKYEGPVYKRSFEPRLIDYEEKNLKNAQSSIKKKEKTLITFLLQDVEFDTEKEYDFEHIIPKNIIKKTNEKYEEKINGGNSLGNITILSTTDNRSKGDKSIYDFAGKYDTMGVEKVFLEDIYYPKKENLSFLNTDEKIVKNSNKMIKERSKNIINEIIKKLLK